MHSSNVSSYSTFVSSFSECLINFWAVWLNKLWANKNDRMLRGIQHKNKKENQNRAKRLALRHYPDDDTISGGQKSSGGEKYERIEILTIRWTVQENLYNAKICSEKKEAAYTCIHADSCFSEWTKETQTKRKIPNLFRFFPIFPVHSKDFCIIQTSKFRSHFLLPLNFCHSTDFSIVQIFGRSAFSPPDFVHPDKMVRIICRHRKKHTK